MNLPDPAEFNFKDCVIAGDECVLITPKEIGCKWNDDNARFRSCIVRKSDNFVVSQGFGKFVNFAEKPDFQPWNHEWPIEARHKLDGSLLIVSKYKGQLICRTRGTVDARQHETGEEVDFLIKKYPLLFDNDYINSGEYVVLCEHTTPSRVIVLREHAEPTLTLLGMVRNDNAVYSPQNLLDELGEAWNVPRPVRYFYDTIAEVIADVEAWVGKEGVVVYSPDGQTLKKFKASAYLRLHKLKSSVSSLRSLIGVFIEAGKPETFDNFYIYIETTLDHELAEFCRDNIGTVVRCHNEIVGKQNKVKELVKNIAGLARKEQALDITQHYKDWRAGYAFGLLDGKQFPDNKLAAILEECIEKQKL